LRLISRSASVWMMCTVHGLGLAEALDAVDGLDEVLELVADAERTPCGATAAG
jgi:ribosomal protein L7/L12